MIAGITDRARTIVKAARHAAELRWRRLPRFALCDEQRGEPTVYCLAPHLTAASGGVRNIYRHVDTLNSVGITAKVVHAPSNFRATWFANDTQVIGAKDVVLGPDDILVVPECYAPGLNELPPGRRVVIFNQGAYHTFDFVPYDATPSGAPYAQIRDLVGVLVVSQANAELIRFAFPALRVQVARPVIDSRLFQPSCNIPPRRIAYVTHRRTQEREQLFHTLRARGVTNGWELAPIEGRTDRETASIMRSSAIFLSFSEREGFGLPPAEAMACGCYVIGYTGLGGQEFFDPADCKPVADGDQLEFARAVEEACTEFDASPDAIAKLGRAASERVTGRYTAAGLRDDLLCFYGPLFTNG